MPKYVVGFVLPAYATGQVVVEAENPDAAEKKFKEIPFRTLAQDHVDDQPFEWDDDKEPEFCFVEREEDMG